MNAEPLHAAQAFRDRPVGHGPDHHVRRFRLQRDKVPERIVGRAAGGYLIVRFGFHRVHEVRKLDGVLNEKHRHVVAHQIEVAFVGEKLHREASYVPDRVARSTRALHGGKTNEYRRFLAWVLQETRLGQHAMVFVGLKVAMGTRAPSVNDALGNAFMVKVRDFFTHDEVFQQRRPAGPGLQGVLIIRHLHALIGAQGLIGGVGAEFFQAIEFGVGIAAVQGIGPGQCALGGGRLLGTHQA